MLSLSMYVCKIKSVIYESYLAVALHRVPDVSLSLQKHRQNPHISYLSGNQNNRFLLFKSDHVTGKDNLSSNHCFTKEI